MQELSPAQKAQEKLYVAKYIAKAFKGAPQGTADREAMFGAAALFAEVVISKRFDTYQWINYDATDPYLLKLLGDDHERQDPKTYYIITGHWYDLLDMLRHEKFCNSADVSGSVFFAQHSAHVAAEMMFRVNGLQEQEYAEEATAVDAVVSYCGVLHIFDNVMFVADPPVGHTQEGSNYRVAWTDAELEKAK